jgi:hypothetical protein
VRHPRFDDSSAMEMNGKAREGMIFKPGLGKGTPPS